MLDKFSAQETQSSSRLTTRKFSAKESRYQKKFITPKSLPSRKFAILNQPAPKKVYCPENIYRQEFTIKKFYHSQSPGGRHQKNLPFLDLQKVYFFKNSSPRKFTIPHPGVEKFARGGGEGSSTSADLGSLVLLVFVTADGVSQTDGANFYIYESTRIRQRRGGFHSNQQGWFAIQGTRGEDQTLCSQPSWKRNSFNDFAAGEDDERQRPDWRGRPGYRNITSNHERDCRGTNLNITT